MAQGNWRYLLDEHLYDMAIELQPIIDDVYMKLRSSVTAYEYANFVSEANGMKKVEKLVDSVKSRDLAVFNEFCEVLEDCGHKDLARKLRGDPPEPVPPQPVEPVHPKPVPPQLVKPVSPQPVKPVSPQPVEPVSPQPVEPVPPQPVLSQPVEPVQPEPVPPQPVDPGLPPDITRMDFNEMPTINVRDSDGSTVKDGPTNPPTSIQPKQPAESSLPVVENQSPPSGTDTPTISLLNIHVRDKVAPSWYDLGVQLLSSEQSEKLDVIKQNHPTDANMCCTEMFKHWLDVDTEASWNKLIAALEQIGQNVLAENIRRNVLKGFHII